MEGDLEPGEPSQEGHGLPSHDTGSGHLMDVPARDDCMGEVGEGREEELVDSLQEKGAFHNPLNYD